MRREAETSSRLNDLKNSARPCRWWPGSIPEGPTTAASSRSNGLPGVDAVPWQQIHAHESKGLQLEAGRARGENRGTRHRPADHTPHPCAAKGTQGTWGP